MMPATRFRRIDELFRAAAQVSASERDAYLQERCGDDPDLKGEVLSLLNEDVEQRGVLDRPAFRATMILSSVSAGDAGANTPPPEMIGRYRVVRELGRGGMGVVYEAIQEHPRRTVALKVIHAGLATPTMLRRFQREAELLGRLQHPGIEAIFEAGSFDTGSGAQPYFAMELVHGRPLNEFADDAKLDRHERLELIARICDAVDHAHQRGVIHRDLKPSNVLIDAAGQPHVLDFGIARATDVDVHTVTMQTDAGQLLGTIPYMSPEQAAGDPKQIDARSDVYSIGVMAYELLAGRLPHDVGHRLVHEAVRIIREDDPTRLSSIDRSLRGDIETIVGKALEKEKTRRYQSAAELARDIRRYLSDQPITARPASAVYQLRKFARRNKAIVGGVAVAFAALALGTVVSVRQAILAERARADESRLRSEAERQAYRASLVAAASALRYHEVNDAKRQLDAAPQHLRGWEWEHLSSRLDQSQAQFDVPYGSTALAVSPDGSMLATCSSGGTVNTWQLADMAPLGSCRVSGGFAERTLVRLQFSPDGRELRAEGRRGASRFDVQTLSLIASDVAPTRARSPDNRFGITIKSLKPHQWSIIHLADNRVVHESTCVDAFDSVMIFSPDSEHVAVCLRGQGGLTIYRSADGEVVCRRADLDRITTLAFSADGARIAIAGMSGGAGVIDARTGGDLVLLRGHPQSVAAIAFNPDATLIATVSGDRAVRLWRADDGFPLTAMHGNQNALNAMAFTPDGSRLITACSDGMLRWWDATATSDPNVLPTSGTVYGVAFSPDGRRIAAACLGGEHPLRIWDAASGTALFAGSHGPLSAVAISPDGTRLVVGRSGTAPCTVYDFDGNELGSFGSHWWRTNWLAFREDGRELLSLGNGGRLVAHDVDSGTQRWRRSFPAESVGEGCRAAISPDGAIVAIASRTEIRLLDASSWQELGKLTASGGNIYALAFSPDGRRLISGSSDRLLRVWDMTTRQLTTMLRSHSSEIFSVVFSQDGRRFLSAGRDHVIRVWDAGRLEEITQLHGHTALVYCMAFSPDGRVLASGGGDATVRLWTTTPLREWRSQRSSSGVD